ncbi:hypothetical protein ACOMHN_005611 [Nucella lapillus]
MARQDDPIDHLFRWCQWRISSLPAADRVHIQGDIVRMVLQKCEEAESRGAQLPKFSTPAATTQAAPQSSPEVETHTLDLSRGSQNLDNSFMRSLPDELSRVLLPTPLLSGDEPGPSGLVRPTSTPKRKRQSSTVTSGSTAVQDLQDLHTPTKLTQTRSPTQRRPRVEWGDLPDFSD